MTFDHIKNHMVTYFHKVKTYTHHHLIKKYFFIGIVIWVLLGWRMQSGSSTAITNVSEYTVATGNIQNTIEAYGSIELVDEQKIRFNQQWDVTAVYFRKGDTVKKWDVIAELDQSSVESNILQAEIGLENAKLQLDETLNGDRSAQILQAENNLEQSKLKLEIAQQEYDDLSWDQTSVDTVSDTETIMANARLDVQNYILEWGKTINQINTDVLNTYQYQQYIWGSTSSLKLAADNAIADASTKLKALQSYFATGMTSTDDRNLLLVWLNLTRELYQALYTSAIDTYTALQNSSYGQDFTPTMAKNLEDEMYTLSTKVKSSLEDITNTINQITKLSSTNDDKITLESKANEIANLKNTIIIQEKTLETTKNWTTEQQLQIAQNGIRQKELALEQTKKDLEDLQIIAPFDGTLRKIDFKVGDKVTSSDEKYVYLENPNLVEVTVLLDQIDIVNVQPGMTVEVVLDSYPNETFEWVLGDIDSTPTTTNGVVSYTVKVAIDKGEKTMYSGMTASVKIIIEDKQNVIIIPTTYIQSVGNTKYVLDADEKQLLIEVGSTNGTMTEITSWLTVGTIIKKSITASTFAKSSTSMMWGMWSMGWAMWGGWPPGQ